MSVTPWWTSRLCLVGIAGLLACGGGSDAQTDATPLPPATKLDLLFMIDNSATAVELQTQVTASFGAFTAQLQARFGGELPDVHVGVISGSVGAGGYAVQSCDGDGDDGRLLSQPRSMCAGPGGDWLEDAPDGSGGRQRNFGSSLEATFACIAELGNSGCGFQQHFEAVRRALDGRHAAHAGFVRADAILAVVIVSDDDDCTASDTQVYDPDAETAIGPLSLFRCARYGWLCNGTELTGGTATYTDCVPRTDSYLTDPADLVSFLQGLKPDPRMVVMAGVFADRAPVVLRENDQGQTQQQNICAALPHSTNIRDRAVVDAFAGIWIDSCDTQLSPGMQRLADHIADRMRAPAP